ncbi:hypothetical protein KSS87_013392 [Heliosperma pusillum]|nr:hypothetical protein KSS87_013392 [Heliosperma pusillum]
MNWKPTKRAIGDIKCGICNSYVKVKVIDMWNIEDNTNTGEFYSIEMILIDEEGCVIQATIGKCSIKRWEDKIKNGHSYKITRFQSIYNKGNHIVVPHSCHLKFGYATTVEEIAIDALLTYGLKFISFKNIVDMNLNICPLKGVDEHVGEKVNEDELPLWFWGPYVVEDTKIAIGKYFTVEKPIVALQCVQWNMTREIDVTFGWYKNVCKVCSAKCGKKNDKKWYCSKEYCSASEEGSIERETRFKVKFYIHDDNGNQAEVIMNDKLIRKKIKITSLECIESFKQEGDMHGIPKELISFLDKEYVLKLEVHRRYNLELNSTCYKLLDYSDNQQLMDEWKQQNETVQNISDDLNDAPTEVVEFKGGNTDVSEENISGITAESSTKWSQEEIGSIGNVETGK